MSNNNNNNFILCMQEFDSLPRKVAGKLVGAGQDKYMNSITTINKNLKLFTGCNLR